MHTVYGAKDWIVASCVAPQRLQLLPQLLPLLTPNGGIERGSLETLFVAAAPQQLPKLPASVGAVNAVPHNGRYSQMPSFSSVFLFVVFCLSITDWMFLLACLLFVYLYSGQWATMLLFSWSVVAPVVCEGRDFS
jgi:hypothetical protein